MIVLTSLCDTKLKVAQKKCYFLNGRELSLILNVSFVKWPMVGLVQTFSERRNKLATNKFCTKRMSAKLIIKLTSRGSLNFFCFYSTWGNYKKYK